jgi:hypothetical protein
LLPKASVDAELGMSMVYQHSRVILPLVYYANMLQEHPPIRCSFTDQGKSEGPLVGLEWYIEAEAIPPIVTHSC